jgi:hypothetical protein
MERVFEGDPDTYYQASGSEAGHLLQLVRLQTVTRREAKKAAQKENPLDNALADDLLATIGELQGEDPLCLRLRKELGTNSSCEGYILDYDGLLQYKGRVLVPTQKALIQELLYLYHNNQLAKY